MRGEMLWLLASLAVAVCSMAAAGPGAGAPAGDEYQVIMWVLGGVPEGREELFFQRLREMNATAVHLPRGESPEVAQRHGFGYYVENIHRIGFLHEAHKVYQEDWQGYTTTRDKRFLIRKPCLHDPEYLARAKDIFQTVARQYADKQPLLYDIGDECSITSFASPMDYCFSEHTLGRFREWLREQYGTLARLNAEWGTSFARWEDVVPMTTYEIKDREKTGSENYAPWADHRTFMDITFAETLGQFRRWLKEVDPATPVGLEGTQMPAAFGGYDLWRLSQALDWVEPYDIGGSQAMFRSFMPPGSPIYATVFEHNAQQASRRLWHLLLNGDRGAIIWCSSDWLDYDSPELTPRPWVYEMGALFAELRGPAARAIMGARREQAPIALLYSHPSVQVSWVIDSRVDGDTWVRRFSSYEPSHSTVTRVRASWMKLIEDLGLQYDFVSSEQVVEGVLETRGYRVVVLPAALALSEAEAARLTAFVRGGGVVIADFLPGVFDEHGKRRQTGALDGLFGVARPGEGMIELPTSSEGSGFEFGGRWLHLGRAEAALKLLVGRPLAGERNGPPVLVERSVGRGKAYYLNVCPIDYSAQRLRGGCDDLRLVAGRLLEAAGVQPPITVTPADEGGPPVGCEVITYQGEGCRYLAVMRNPEYSISDLGEIGEADNALFERPLRLAIALPEAARVRELMSGREYGRVERLEAWLDPWKPLLFELR